MKKILLFGIMVLVMMGMAFAQPDSPPPETDDPFETTDGAFSLIGGEEETPSIDLTPSGSSLSGSSCSNQYATTNEYCSGEVRIYYQCLPTADGLEWQQRSENCGDYVGGGRCVEEGNKAKCVDMGGDTSYGKTVLALSMVLIIIGSILGYYVSPWLYTIILPGIILLIQFILGGV